MNRDAKINSVIGLLIMLFSLLLVSELVAVTHEETWEITYEYAPQPPGSGVPSPVELSEGTVLSLPISVSASATIRVTSPGGITQTHVVSNIDGSGFSHTFVMGEIGEYDVNEEYILTLQDTIFTGAMKTFASIATWNYNNSSLGGALFELKDMYITNYDGQLVSDVLEVLPPILPDPCRPDDPDDTDDPDGTINISIRTTRDIADGDNLLDLISLKADWYKKSSLTAVADNEAPVIIHNLVDVGWAGTTPVYANVMDNLQVTSVVLNLTDSASRNFQVEMTPIDGEGNYQGIIPLGARTGDGGYYIWATDVAGNEAVYPADDPHPIYIFGLAVGDVDEDDDIDENDADLVLQNAIGQRDFTDMEKILGDTSGDETISPYDSGLIRQHWQGMINTFPVENGGALPSGSVDVSILDYTERPGNGITVPITVGNTNGLEIIGIDMTFTYDPGILTLTNITASGTLASQWARLTDTSVAGQIVVAMAHHEKLNGSGAIIKFEFDVSGAATDGQTSPLTLSNMSIDEGNITANITNGLFTVIELVDMVIPLGAGWNIFSICVELEDYDLESVLEPIEDNIKSVWAYFSNPGWKRHIYDGPADDNDLVNIVPGQGYLIEMKIEDELSITGMPLSNTSIPVNPGWNLLGYNSQEARSPENAMLPAGVSVHAYDNETETWRRYFPGDLNFLNEIELLESGMGYWMYAIGSGVWTVSP